MKSAFRKLFGDSDEVRILDFFLMHKLNSHALQEVAELCGVPIKKVIPIMQKLSSAGLVTQKRHKYTLSMKNRSVVQLLRVDSSLTAQEENRMLGTPESGKIMVSCE